MSTGVRLECSCHAPVSDAQNNQESYADPKYNDSLHGLGYMAWVA